MIANIVIIVIEVAAFFFGTYAAYKFGQSQERARWWSDATEVSRRIRIAGGLQTAIAEAVGTGGKSSISCNVDEIAAAITCAYHVGMEEVNP